MLLCTFDCVFGGGVVFGVVGGSGSGSGSGLGLGWGFGVVFCGLCLVSFFFAGFCGAVSAMGIVVVRVACSTTSVAPYVAM